MKPASPEDRELDALAADLSAAWRKVASEQPPARLDAAILEAARAQAGRRRKRDWHLPASIAAMLLIGVTLALMTSEIEDPLPPPDPGPAGRGAQPAATADASSAPTMKAAPQAPPAHDLQSVPQGGGEIGARPSRERSARIEAQSAARVAVPDADVPVAAPAADSGQSAPAPAAESLSKKEALADSAPDSRAAGVSRHEEQAAATTAAPQSPAMPPADWLERIEKILREDRRADAQRELARFRVHYPDYPLPQQLRELVPEAKR